MGVLFCRNRLGGERKQDGEGSTFPDLAFNGKHALMAIHDVLHNGKSEPGTTSRPAGGCIHPVESFGQAREIFSGDTRSIVAHGEAKHRLSASFRAAKSNVDPLAGAAIAERIVSKVLHDLRKLIPVPENEGE